MAELLIKAIDATHADPDIDRRGCYKTGDVVVVREDGHEWGALERPPIFRVLRLPGVPAADVEDLAAEQIEDDNGVVQSDTFRRRAWRLDMERLPAAARAALERDGQTGVARGIARAALRRKRDNVQHAKL